MFFKNFLVGCLIGAAQILVSSGDPDVPDIPTRYYTMVEGNIANKNKTYIMEEWYDKDANKAKRVFHSGEYIFTILEDYANETDELWIFGQSQSDLDDSFYCSLEAYSNKTDKWLNALQVLGQWLEADGDMTDATFMGPVGDVDDNGMEAGDYNLRGIHGNKWIKTTISNGTTSSGETYYDVYNISYYWTVPNWTYASQNGAPLPIRIEVDGTHNSTNGTTDTYYEFYHSYEYVAFLSGDGAFDDDVLDFYLEMPDWVDECDTSHYCQHYPDAQVCSDSQGPSLPELSDQFLMTIEANDAINNVTYLMYEHYDYANDRAHVVFYWDDEYKGNAIHQLDLDKYEQRWFWVGEESDNYDTTLDYCTMSLIESNYTGFDFFIQEVNGHIARPSVWFHFNTSNTNNKVWLGYTTIREHIMAEKWKSVWYEGYRIMDFWVVLNCTSYYYFNRDSWNMSFSNWDSNSPLRLELEGYYEIYNITDDGDRNYWLNGSIDVSYDLIGFVNDYVDDSVFDIPNNWREECTISEDYCNDDRFSDLDVCYDGPELPTLPDQFQTTVECVFVSKNYSMVVDEFYDYTNNRERVIMYPYNYVSSIFGFEFAVDYSTHYLEDGEIFWSWTQSNGEGVDMDGREIDNCKLYETESISGNGIDAWFDSENRHVQTTARLFSWVTNNSVQTYLGTSEVRGIPVDQWKHKLETIETSFDGTDGTTYDYEINMTVVYSFMTDAFKSTDIYGDTGVPVRADVWGHSVVTSDGSQVAEYDYEHYYDYVKFYPYQPDEYWFEPPNNVTCNITSYCATLESDTESSSSSDDVGESSDEYEDWCDEADADGMVVTDVVRSSSGCSSASSSSEDNDNDNDASVAGIWVVAILLAIICGVGGFFFGRYKEKQQQPKVRLQDMDANKM